MNEIKLLEGPSSGRKPAGPADRMVGWVAAGMVITTGLLGGIVAWAATTAIDGAIIAPGMVAVESQRKQVQHLEGGIVAETLVRDGDYVEAGQILVRLDDTAFRAELATTQDRLAALWAQRARLRAELDDRFEVALPPTLKARETEPKIAAIIENERGLFFSKQDSQRATEDLLNRRMRALEAQIDGQERRRSANLAELDLLREELGNLEPLLEKRLVPTSRVLEVRRAVTSQEANIASAEAEMESLDAQVREVHAQLRQARSTAQADAATELANTQAEIHTLEEQRTVLEDRLTRGAILAPQAGRVINLAVNVAGAVVGPGETVMEIVPVDDSLVLQARIQPTDVERIHVGQEAVVRLTAFNQNTTPELTGRVEGISADALIEQETGRAYYNATVVLNDSAALAPIKGELLPGMPAEILVSTGERLASSYLLRPLTDAYQRSFRDE